MWRELRAQSSIATSCGKAVTAAPLDLARRRATIALWASTAARWRISAARPQRSKRQRGATDRRGAFWLKVGCYWRRSTTSRVGEVSKLTVRRLRLIRELHASALEQ